MLVCHIHGNVDLLLYRTRCTSISGICHYQFSWHLLIEHGDDGAKSPYSTDDCWTIWSKLFAADTVAMLKLEIPTSLNRQSITLPHYILSKSVWPWMTQQTSFHIILHKTVAFRANCIKFTDTVPMKSSFWQYMVYGGLVLRPTYCL